MNNCWDRVNWLRIDVSEGCRNPWGYGLAYWRWDCRKAVCYPFPLNWVVWLFREIWWRVRDVPKGSEIKIYQKGWEDGYETGQRMADHNSYHKLVEFTKEIMVERNNE